MILDTDAFAETVGSVINGEPVATVLTAAMTGGMFGSGALLAGGIARHALDAESHRPARRPGRQPDDHLFLR